MISLSGLRNWPCRPSRAQSPGERGHLKRWVSLSMHWRRAIMHLFKNNRREGISPAGSQFVFGTRAGRPPAACRLAQRAHWALWAPWAPWYPSCFVPNTAHAKFGGFVLGQRWVGASKTVFFGVRRVLECLSGVSWRAAVEFKFSVFRIRQGWQAYSRPAIKKQL